MFQNNSLKKLVAAVCIFFAGIFSFANCFGSFGIVKAIYNAHRGLRIGSGLLMKFIQTILMYFPFSILYALGFVADILLFNLVEFWTGTNPVAKSDFDSEGKLVREFQNGKDHIRLTYLNYGERLDMEITSQGRTEKFIALKGKEGVLFQEVNGKLKEIQVTSSEAGSQTILKLYLDGELKSARVVNSKELQKIEESTLVKM